MEPFFFFFLFLRLQAYVLLKAVSIARETVEVSVTSIYSRYRIETLAVTFLWYYSIICRKIPLLKEIVMSDCKEHESTQLIC